MAQTATKTRFRRPDFVRLAAIQESQNAGNAAFTGFFWHNYYTNLCIKMLVLIDPCCGSGGFFLASQSFIADPENYSLDREQKEFLKNETFYGNEIVSATYKTALMNLYLHNIGDIYGNVPIAYGDALLTDLGYRVDYVLTNPPFGKKSALTFTNEAGEQEEEDLVYNRQDF